ncbi:hypothetical protein PR202_gb23141 [Eleusine coracana subsp. coracana]|uniref:RING-type domain-containing protein n=1 Tax=Eleusine coracana subsp. coracana TaxID=191504 RepID=A0AAV5FIF8_ELECO|nr:hypothetical protein QOZ80_6BG0482140 [Eleusine coracana subsp. coracana]GJN34478.1 hypothetical protein PR202_gb23141 [Eleusine coracana subsp. coracana]
MRTSGGGGCAVVEGHCYSAARRLLGGGGGAVAPAAALSLSADRARLERVLCATTAVLFAASLTYVALSTIFACLRAARRSQPSPDAEPAAAAAEMMETTKRALDEIPVVAVHVRDGEDEECAVCLAPYADGEEVRVLPACRHAFHRDCVDRWLLTRAPTCPVCRAPVVAGSSEARDAKGCAATDDVVLPVTS